MLAAVVDDLPSMHTSLSSPEKRREKGYSWFITDSPGIISPAPISKGPDVAVEAQDKSRVNEANVDPHGRPVVTRKSGRTTNWGSEKPVPMVFTFPAGISGLSVEGGRSVTLPLANTLFQTGKISTLARFTVHRDSVTGEKNENGTKPEAWDTANRVYTIAIPKQVLGYCHSFSHYIPLLPLTDPRQVHACAGNILRQLRHPRDPPLPASRELEDAVGAYLAQNTGQGKVEIFAHITPYEPTSTIIPWNIYTPASGGTLRRVLSGGGGWGKKAGLLSLDPQGGTYALNDEQYEKLHYDDDEVREGGVAGDDGGDSDDGGEFKQRFEETFFGSRDDIRDVRGPDHPNSNPPRPSNTIIQSGDWIQFYIVEDDPTDSLTPIPPPCSSSSTSTSTSLSASSKLVFGCVPKDDASPPSPFHSGPSKRGIIHRKGVFGAKSEEGVWIHRAHEEPGLASGGSEAPETKSKTEIQQPRGGRGKLDVPGAEVGVFIQ